MLALYNFWKMPALGTKLRFMACEQIESALTGMFPAVEVLPFGSSVNSFGKFDADLDMVLDFAPTWVSLVLFICCRIELMW